MSENAGQPSIAVIGVGNDDRGDDGAGLAVARMVAADGIEGVRVHTPAQCCLTLIDLWQDADAAFVIDAVRSSGPPGTVYRIDALTQELPRSLFCHSTHAFGVIEALELSRTLGMAPRSLTIYGIAGADFGVGRGLTPEVEAAARACAQQISRETQCLTAAARC